MSRTERIDNIDPEAFQAWLRYQGIRVFSEKELEGDYIDLLDDEPAIIGCLEYQKSFILEQIDPIAYRCGFSDFLDVYPAIQNCELFGGDYLDEGEDEDDLIDRYLEENPEDEEEED